jgi:transposase InsO family protein
MSDIFKLILRAVIELFRSKASLEMEILTPCHQINVLRRSSAKRPAFTNIDRLVFAALYRLVPRVVNALVIVEPETVIGWHRAGFRLFCRWKSRCRRGRPKVLLEIRQLIRDMSLANPLWGAPRIHGELLKLGIDVGQTSVAKYMAWQRRPPSQAWRTFLRNHADGIASIDLFVVSTISFRLLYGLLILRHSRRRILWLGVTAQPTAEWIARQLTEACGWEPAPRYIVRDRDRVYGEVFTRRLRAMGIRDQPTAPRSPWQNGHTERLIGSIRRECLIMSSCSATGTCAMCFSRTCSIIMAPGPTISKQGRAGTTSRSGHRAHSTDANSWRITPSVCSGLIFDRDTVSNRTRSRFHCRCQISQPMRNCFCRVGGTRLKMIVLRPPFEHHFNSH